MEGLDEAVGQIRDKVQELGIAEDTILMFTSDNGPEDGQDYNIDGLRANKRELYEGGVRVPGIFEWQGQIEPGVSHTPMVTTDYLPTLLDIWGIDPVDDRPIDGISMAETVFNDREATRDQTIVFKSTNGHQAAMGVDGQYKLISTNNGSSWALYDLVNDYRERSPLATNANIDSQDAATQDIFDQLMGEYDAWVGSVANSTSDNLSGDYQTRIAESEGLSIMREPPQSLENDTLGSDDESLTNLYLERQYATLRSDLTIDSDGSTGLHGTDKSATLAQGTVAHSFLIDFDSTTDNAMANMELTFEDKILGVIGESSSLIDSDALSFADPEFEEDSVRGLEAGDSWTISNDGFTISFDLQTSIADLDQVRILTESSLQFSPVPEPAPLVLVGISCLLTSGLRRRR